MGYRSGNRWAGKSITDTSTDPKRMLPKRVRGQGNDEKP